jgi:CMP-N,N'-diacetyllegionaminic acid synthase
MPANDYVAFVPIRGGSKGLENKNIKHFAGLPLYEHAVRQGLRVCSRCVVSTDIESVLNADITDARLIHRRPANLATDNAPMDVVLRDGIESLALAGRSIVLLQATSPLRNDDIIEGAIACHRTGAHDLVLSATLDDRSILKSGMIEDGKFLPVSKPEYCFSNRQSLPDIYRPNGAVFVFSADWFLANGGLATDKIGAVTMPAAQSYDIDTQDDFTRAEALFHDAGAVHVVHGQ